jgi:mannosyltransferase
MLVETRSNNRQMWITVCLVGLAILLGTALRLYDLGGRNLWLDEIFTATFAHADHSLATVVDYALSTPIPAPPLWFIITHLSIKMLGSSEFALRLPVALCGILSLAVTYRLGKTLFGRTEGLIAVFLLSVSPFHIYYSREARYYAALILLSLLTVYFLYLAIQRQEWQWWAIFVAVTVANIYIHLMAFVVLLVEVLFVGILWMWQRIIPDEAPVTQAVGQRQEMTLRKTGSRIKLIPVLLGLGVIVLSYLPMWSRIIQGLLGPRGLGNPEMAEKLDLSVPFFIKIFSLFGAGTGWAFALFMGAFLWGIIVSVLAQRRQSLFMLLWITIPFVFIFVVRPKHFFDPKYLIFILPVYLIGVATGIAEMGRSIDDLVRGGIKRSATVLGTLGVTVAFTMINIRAMSDVYEATPDDWGDVGRFLQYNVTSDDAIVCLPVSFVTLPVEDVLAYYGPDPNQIEVEVTAWPSYLEKIYATHRRLWLVSTHYTWVNRSLDLAQWLREKNGVELRFDQEFRILIMGEGVTRDELLTEAMTLSIPDASAWGSLAGTLEAEGRVEEAITAYKSALERSPEDGAWHARLGHIYYKQDQSDQAITEYREAIRLSPDIPGFHSDLAAILSEVGDQRAALAEYKKAMRLYLRQRRGSEDAPYVQSLKQAIAEIESGQ